MHLTKFILLAMQILEYPKMSFVWLYSMLLNLPITKKENSFKVTKVFVKLTPW